MTDGMKDKLWTVLRYVLFGVVVIVAIFTVGSTGLTFDKVREYIMLRKKGYKRKDNILYSKYEGKIVDIPPEFEGASVVEIGSTTAVVLAPGTTAKYIDEETVEITHILENRKDAQPIDNSAKNKLTNG
jgi:hypothetical protein